MWKYIAGGVALVGLGWVIGYVVAMRKANKMAKDYEAKLLQQKQYYDSVMVGTSMPAGSGPQTPPNTTNAAPERQTA